MDIGSRVKLIPKTRHARAVVSQHGDTARVILVKESMVCVTTPDGNWRWLTRWNDADEHFSWEVLDGTGKDYSLDDGGWSPHDEGS